MGYFIVSVQSPDHLLNMSFFPSDLFAKQEAQKMIPQTLFNNNKKDHPRFSVRRDEMTQSLLWQKRPRASMQQRTPFPMMTSGSASSMPRPSLQQRTPFPIGNLGFASPMPRASLRHAFPTGNLRSSRDHPGTCPIMRAETQRLRDENSRLRAELQRVRLVRSEPRSEEGELTPL